MEQLFFLGIVILIICASAYFISQRRKGGTILVVLESTKEGEKDSMHHRMLKSKTRLTPDEIFDFAETQIESLEGEGRDAIVTNIQYFE